MHHLKSIWTITVISLILSACATSSIDLAPESPDRPWEPPTTSKGEIISGKSHNIQQKKILGTVNGYRLPKNINLAVLPGKFQADPSKTYSLVDLIDIAESSHPETRIAWNKARNAALASGIAEAAYLPKIAFSVMAGYHEHHDWIEVDGFTADTGSHSQGSVSAVSLQWLLFDFGQRSATVEAAQQATNITNIAFTASHQKVIYEVSLAFYAYGAAHWWLKSAQESLTNADAILAASEERYHSGIGTIIEVAQARHGRAQANLNLVQAQGGESDTYLALLSAVGISPLSTLKIASLPKLPLPQNTKSDIDRFVADAVSRRPDVLSAYASLRASQARIKAKEAAFLPKVFASATSHYSSGNFGVSAIPYIGEPPIVNLSSRHGNALFVGLTVPIYDGGVRAAMLAQARNEADNAKTILEQSQKEAVRQIVMAQNTLHTRLAACDAAQAMVVAAQTAYDASYEAYCNGVGSITATNLARNQLLLAKNAYSDIYASTLSAAVTLTYITGSLGGPVEGSQGRP